MNHKILFLAFFLLLAAVSAQRPNIRVSSGSGNRNTQNPKIKVPSGIADRSAQNPNIEDSGMEDRAPPTLYICAVDSDCEDGERCAQLEHGKLCVKTT